MTIIDILLEHIHDKNPYERQALEIIRDSYISSVNDNYTLIVDPNGELLVRIPSMEKRDEFVYNKLTEYSYPLIMCMNIDEINNTEYYSYIKAKFLECYRDKLHVFFKDVITVNKLKDDIVKTKKKIEYITYFTIIGVILSGLSLCIFNVENTTKYILAIGIILLFGCALYLQLTKENTIKKLIDGYISTIYTDWYNTVLRKHYTFLCNFMG